MRGMKMAYFKCIVDGPIAQELTEREVIILQNTFLNLAAMTNALIVGQGVMLNPPDDGDLGIVFAYPEAIPAEKETEVKEAFANKLNVFFEMSNLALTTEFK